LENEVFHILSACAPYNRKPSIDIHEKCQRRWSYISRIRARILPVINFRKHSHKKPPAWTLLHRRHDDITSPTAGRASTEHGFSFEIVGLIITGSQNLIIELWGQW